MRASSAPPARESEVRRSLQEVLNGFLNVKEKLLSGGDLRARSAEGQSIVHQRKRVLLFGELARMAVTQAASGNSEESRSLSLCYDIMNLTWRMDTVLEAVSWETSPGKALMKSCSARTTA